MCQGKIANFIFSHQPLHTFPEKQKLFLRFFRANPLEKPDALWPAPKPSFLSVKFFLSTRNPGNFALRDIFSIGLVLRNEYFQLSQ